MSNLVSFWEVMCFHPFSSTKKMGFCILFRLTLRIQVSFLSSFDKLSGEQALQYLQGLDVLELVVVVAGWVHYDQFEQDLELEFEMQELVQRSDLQGLEPDFDLWDHELGFELQDPEPDFVLQDPVLDLQDLKLHQQNDLEHLD